MDISKLKFDARGLITAVVQDANTHEVLMVAWMNAESLRLTEERGEAVFWSRSRQEIWHKGATSGNVQRVREIRVDCDADTLLLLVDPAGPACHTGERSCFYRNIKMENVMADKNNLDAQPQEPGWLTRLRPAAKQRRRTQMVKIRWHDLQELLREYDRLWHEASPEAREAIVTTRQEYGRNSH